ncbi:MAG: ATP-binding protein [Chitinivibrionia bacterium]|nr:ATP-binding protein [Chitinivibrionia bacterium]
MKILNKPEIEFKILIVASLFFALFGLFFVYLYENELDIAVRKGMNSNLTDFLRRQADTIPEAQGLLEHQLQWEATAPFIAKTQKDNLRNMILYFLALVMLLMFFIIRYITSPIKKREKIAAIEKTWRDIAKTMAHEIKNPLTPMRLSIDKIEEKATFSQNISSEEIAKFTKRINEQIDNLEDLVNKFKSFSQKQTANLQSAYLRDVIIKGTAGMSDKIKTQINGDAFAILDVSFFNQILLNLYKNSIGAGANAMQIDISEFGRKTLISFTDNGKGIEKEKLDIVFLPYITFSENGSGIGLSVVKSLVESMGGKVYAQNPEQSGFKIIIELERTKNGA